MKSNIKTNTTYFTCVVKLSSVLVILKIINEHNIIYNFRYLINNSTLIDRVF